MRDARREDASADEERAERLGRTSSGGASCRWGAVSVDSCWADAGAVPVSSVGEEGSAEATVLLVLSMLGR